MDPFLVQKTDLSSKSMPQPTTSRTRRERQAGEKEKTRKMEVNHLVA